LEIRVGYELIYDCPQPTPMMLVLHIHYSRASDIIVPDHVTTTPSLPLSAYRELRQLVHTSRRPRRAAHNREHGPGQGLRRARHCRTLRAATFDPGIA
jgi:hypothetical protein